MKRIIIVFLLISTVFIIPLASKNYQKDYREFNRGIAYLLIGDKGLAATHLEAYFEMYTDTALRGAFISLIDRRDSDVTKQFKQYLDINHRSSVALVGIALSTSGLKDSTSLSNLERARRLEPKLAASYLCLGMEYQLKKNYPRAASYFRQASNLTSVPEVKILSARLQLEQNESKAVLTLMKANADRQPDNFYFNFLTARAYFQLGKIEDMEKYVESALDAGPNNIDAQILYAKYLLSLKKYRRAKNTLKTIKAAGSNIDYLKTYGRVLLELKDRNTKTFLDDAYAKDGWDPEVNYLMARFSQWKKQGNVGNWVYRSLISGVPADRLKSDVGNSYRFPPLVNIPFFHVSFVKWINDRLFVAGAVKKSGDNPALYVIDGVENKIIQSLPYKGEFQDVYLSDKKNSMIITAIPEQDDGLYVYAVNAAGKRFSIHKVYNKPVPVSAAEVGFNRAGSLVYFTDQRILQKAFVAPFNIASQMGKKKPVYPEYPFPIFKYNYATRQLFQITDPHTMEKTPIDCVKKYFLVAEMSEQNDRVMNLVSKGERLELTSSEIVKIFFSDDIDSFLIYLSDLRNAFQAVLVDRFNDKILEINETMFLGKGEYAEIQMINFNPEKQEIIVLTADNNRNLIRFNYNTHLYTVLAGKVLQTHLDQERGIVYALTERGKKRHYKETNLEIIKLQPYLKTRIDSKRDLNKMLFFENHSNYYFSSYFGELLKRGDDGELHYVGPSYEGTVYGVSPNTKKTAAFVNGKLFIVDTEMEEYDMLKDLRKKRKR